MSDNTPTQTKGKVKPWISQTGPLISFLCDDGGFYLSQFSSIAAVSPNPGVLEVLAPPHGLEMVDPLAAPEAGEDFGFLVEKFVGDDARDRLPDHLVGGLQRADWGGGDLPDRLQGRQPGVDEL